MTPTTREVVPIKSHSETRIQENGEGTSRTMQLTPGTYLPDEGKEHPSKIEGKQGS